MQPQPSIKPRALTGRTALLWALAAVISFHLAYGSALLAPLIVFFLFSLFQLRELNSSRKAFYIGLALGFAIYAPQLSFFWKLFQGGAIALWLVLAFWIAAFLLLAQLAHKKLGPTKSALLIPFLWTGLEFFRSELYYLRFSWVNVGYVFADSPRVISCLGGVYGTGFWLMLFMAVYSIRRIIPGTGKVGLLTFTILILIAKLLPPFVGGGPASAVKVAGIQMERFFPNQHDVVVGLDKVLKQYPEANLFLLSEYTFHDPVPQIVKDWCKRNQKYLLLGAIDPVGTANFYDTAFVIGPEGEIVFQQAKSIPIQFMKDGLPATEQKVWNSPWGKIGICICYDLSYRRVADELVQQGAQALIVPTMDVIDWGLHQHEMHSRVGPTRAAEFGIPVVRMASSGISQIVNADGSVQASASFPGENEMISGLLVLKRAGRLPFDHWFAPVCVLITVLTILWLCFSNWFGKSKQKL